jgi:hypothetical protein
MAVKTHTLLTLGALLLAAMSLLSFVSASPAMATVGWSVRSIAEPTHFSANDEAKCNGGPGICDMYQLVVRNVGDETSNGPITVTDTLPLPPAGPPAAPGSTPGSTEFGAEGWKCTSEVVGGRPTVTCTSEHEQQVAPEAYTPNEAEQATSFSIPVLAPSATAGTLRNEVTVTGGGATTAGSTVEETASISTKPPAFEVTDFSFEAIKVGGGADTQAGAHPYDLTASFDLADVFRPIVEADPQPVEPVENPRAAVVELPLGFIGDPRATPTCPETELAACPPASRIGVATLDQEGKLYLTGAGYGASESAIYNVAPEAGYPAEFAFEIAGRTIPMYASVVHTGSGYRVRVATPGIPAAQGPVGVSLTFFGNPAALDKTGGQPVAFFTNPADCSAGPLTARIELDSWENPGRWVSKESTTYPQVSGCNMLQFNPSLELAPSRSSEGGTTQADEPSGYNVDLKVPQSGLFEELATPELKDATVTLPEGVSVSPSAADGLAGCRETGPEGIDISHGVSGHEAGEGEAIGVDGLPHMTPGHCPGASTLGTVEVFTPLLPTRCGSEGQATCKVGESAAPLQGHLYLAQPKCGGEGQPACTEASATNGELFGLYIEVEDPAAGVIVKLPGTVAANPATGQLTGTFKENPQLPFSELRLHFNSGPRAPLANPQTCGSFTTTSDLTPWSAPVTPDATPSSPPFAIGGCGSPMPFAPSFSAGTLTPAAGAFSPFTLTFSRQDREQDLAQITLNTPPGLLGKIAGIPQCPEAQANAGTCSAASQIGTASAAAGAGSHPFWVSGPVYLTGPYKGAPFGLSVVVPAKAGPFNLGNEIVRSAIHIDPNTSALTIVSDPLPQKLDGIPFRLQTVNVTVDRPGFIFNPTTCAQQSITATISAFQGASAGVSSPFAVTGCATLPFKPDFSASTDGHTSKQNGASLKVKIASAGIGVANIAKVDLTIPAILPSRLTTLQQACTEAQFNSNPAGCPAASNIATATVHTPLLSSPLTGPVFFVSHGGAAFPDTEIILQGEGVKLVLDGHTQITKGVTYSKFETVPDAPFTSFEFNAPEGPYSIFAANGNLCQTEVKMPTSITAQNGAVLKQNTNIAVTGCGKPSIKITKAKIKGNTVLVTVTTSQQGTVTVSGHGLKTIKNTLAAGAHQLKVSLTKNGRSARKHHKKIKVKASVKDANGSSSKTMTLKL